MQNLIVIGNSNDSLFVLKIIPDALTEPLSFENYRKILLSKHLFLGKYISQVP